MRSELTAALPDAEVGLRAAATTGEATGGSAGVRVHGLVTRLGELQAGIREVPVSVSLASSATPNPEYLRILKEQAHIIATLRALRRQTSPVARPERATSFACQGAPR